MTIKRKEIHRLFHFLKCKISKENISKFSNYLKYMYSIIIVIYYVSICSYMYFQEANMIYIRKPV